MGSSVELQPWMTLQAATGVTGRTQPVQNWVNTVEFQAGVLQIECPKVSGCTLLVEGCDDVGGSFTTIRSFTQGATLVPLLYLKRSDYYGSEKRLPQYLRWRIDPDVSDVWETTFRVNLVLK